MFDSDHDQAAARSQASGSNDVCSEAAPPGGAWRDVRPEPWRRLSHELGTPLHAILGHAELLLDGSFGPLGGEVKSCVAEMQGAGRQLALEFRRLLLIVEAAGAPRRERELVDVESLFRHAFAKRADDRLAWQGGPLIVAGERFWLRVMAEAVADALIGDRRTEPVAVRTPPPDGQVLEIASPWLAEQDVDPIPLALVQVVAARHGAEAVWLTEGGLRVAGLTMH